MDFISICKTSNLLSGFVRKSSTTHRHHPVRMLKTPMGQFWDSSKQMTTNDGDKVEIMSESTTLLCTGHIQPDQATFPWLDFASQGFSTLLGALLAFLFGLVLYQKQKTHEMDVFLGILFSCFYYLGTRFSI